MKIFVQITLIISILLGFVPVAYGDDSKEDWMNSDILSLGNILPRCIDVPPVSGMNNSSISLNIENQGEWFPSGVYVQEGKMLGLKWNTNGISSRPRKYRILYRVDPRFSFPQIFIQRYDYSQNKYISDYHNYQNGILPILQNDQNLSATKIGLINDYFYNSYLGLSPIEPITVNKGDVINITLDGTGSFFGSDTQMQNGLGIGDNLMTIFTDSSGINNKIMYVSAKQWCSDIITTKDQKFDIKCPAGSQTYINPTDNWHTLTGRPSDASFTSKITSIPSCPNESDGPDNNPACFYDKGRGFDIYLGGKNIKPASNKFIYSVFTGKYFFYHYSDVQDKLLFSTLWPIDGMYPEINQLMTQWSAYGASPLLGYVNLLDYLNSSDANAKMQFLHFGVYSMELEIGNGSGVLSDADLNSIGVDYTIIPSGTPNAGSTANAAAQNFKDNAYTTGYLWLRVSGGGGKSGNINVDISNYQGANWFSSIVYDDIVTPLRDKYNELSEIIYRKLIGTPALQNIAKLLLVIYIIIYGLFFLGGAVQITATDLIVRVVKISIIVALFSETSWTFFNNNLFNVFVSGSDYLFSQVLGVTSSTTNIFGFIDPIFERYTNPHLWALLGIQILQIHNGLAFFAIMTIYAILIYFRAILEVIITYCLAFLGLAVMISLAPFFILMMLFERTKTMFDNWLSTLFSYMIQPTILLIFFLLIDQMMAEYITGTVVKACWGILIPLKIGLDLSNIHIPLKFSFSLPFLPGIPFYIPQVENIDSASTLISNKATFVRVASSSFIFFIYCKLASGLVDYVSLIVQSLTDVLAARQDGSRQSGKNIVDDITGDMKKLASPVTGAIKGAGGFVKEKFSDQKITHRTSTKMSDVDYSKIRKIEGGVEDLVSKESKQSSPPKLPEKGQRYNEMSKEISDKKEKSSLKNTDQQSVEKNVTPKISAENIQNKEQISNASKSAQLQSRTSSDSYQTKSSSLKGADVPGNLSKTLDNDKTLQTDNKETQSRQDSVAKNRELENQQNKDTQNIEEFTKKAGIGDRIKNLSKEQKQELQKKFTKPGASRKVNRKTDDVLQKKDEDQKSSLSDSKTDKNNDNTNIPKDTKSGFSTKKAGIGDRVKNLSKEQKIELQKKFKKTGAGQKINRRTDNKLKQKEDKSDK